MSKVVFLIGYLLISLVSLSLSAVEFTDCNFRSKHYFCAKDVAYGKDELQKFDLWLPDTAQTIAQVPLVIFIHGGGYAAGDKDKGYIPRIGIERYLAAGYAFATINYRLSGTHPFVKSKEMPHPIFMRDAGLAIQFLRAHAIEMKIDPKKIALTGISAGGGISLWLGLHDDLADKENVDPVLRQSTRVSCVSVAGTQTTLNIEEVQEVLGNDEYYYEIDNRIPQFYGLANKREYLANPEQHNQRLLESMHEASPISHLDEKDKDVKIKLSYALDYESFNIHGPEFGAYIAEGKRKGITDKYKRKNFKDIGLYYEFESGLRRQQNNSMVEFVLNHCFK